VSADDDLEVVVRRLAELSPGDLAQAIQTGLRALEAAGALTRVPTVLDATHVQFSQLHQHVERQLKALDAVEARIGQIWSPHMRLWDLVKTLPQEDRDAIAHALLRGGWEAARDLLPPDDEEAGG
jgi:hypothetical protein